MKTSEHWKVGLGFWLILVLAQQAGYIHLGMAERLLALACLVTVPLGLTLVSPEGHPCQVGCTVAALPAVAALLLPVGRLALGLGGTWFLATLAVAAWSVKRLLRQGFRTPPENAVSAGLLYLPVGGAWFRLSRTGQAPSTPPSRCSPLCISTMPVLPPPCYPVLQDADLACPHQFSG